MVNLAARTLEHTGDPGHIGHPLAGIGPGPMCAMLLADLGATVIRIDRKQPAELGIKRPLRYNLLLRNPSAINMLDGCALSLPCHAAGEAPAGLMLAGAGGRDHDILALGEAMQHSLRAAGIGA